MVGNGRFPRGDYLSHSLLWASCLFWGTFFATLAAVFVLFG